MSKWANLDLSSGRRWFFSLRYVLQREKTEATGKPAADLQQSLAT
jgi:hypothetical protein